jgi:PAS domain-containing protein
VLFLFGVTQLLIPSVALFCPFHEIKSPILLILQYKKATMALSIPIEVNSLPMDRSAGFHHKVVDAIEDLLLVLAEDGRISYASPKSYSLIQVKSEAMVGQYISTYMNVDDIPVFLVDFKEHMASGTSWRSHHRLRRADDTFNPFESTFTPYTGVAADSTTGSRRSTKMCLMTARP